MSEVPLSRSTVPRGELASEALSLLHVFSLVSRALKDPCREKSRRKGIEELTSTLEVSPMYYRNSTSAEVPRSQETPPS